jgi:hypothetical protein
MKSVIASIVAVAGIAAAANAQNVYETGTTRMVFEVSTNGADWSSSVNVAPSTPVAFRVRFVYTGTASIAKLAEARFQPTISGWTAGQDVLAPFHNAGGGTNTSAVLGYLPDSNSMPVSIHKVGPLAGTSQVSSGAGNVTSFVSGSLLRIAGANATQAVGAGATNNNVNGLWGVILQQNTQSGTVLGSNVVGYKGLFTVSSSSAARSYGVGTAAGSIQTISGGTDPNFKGVFWSSTSNTALTGDIRSSVVIEGATVNIIPAPGAAALLGLGGLAAARRRRA